MANRWTERLTELAAAEKVPGAVLGIWADGQETVAAHGLTSTATTASSVTSPTWPMRL
jgi:hypothetical protein